MEVLHLFLCCDWFTEANDRDSVAPYVEVLHPFLFCDWFTEVDDRDSVAPYVVAGVIVLLAGPICWGAIVSVWAYVKIADDIEDYHDEQFERSHFAEMRSMRQK